VLQVLLVRDLHRTRLTKSAELRWGACRFKPLGGVAVSSLIATPWLPTSAALVGHRGLLSWPRCVVHGPAVSALIICPPALYVCVLSRLRSSGFLEQAYRDQTPFIIVPQLWEPLLGGCDRAIPNPNLLIKSYAYKIKCLLKNVVLLYSPGSHANALDAGP